MKRCFGILIAVALAPWAIAGDDVLLENRLAAPVVWRLSLEGETARLEVARGPIGSGGSVLPAGETARPAAPATRWIVSVGPVALETVAGDGVRIVLSSARFQGVDFVEVAAWRGQAVESSRTLFLPLAGEDLEARRGRLAEEVRRQELELEIRRLEAKLAWIADERRRLYLPPPGTGRYVGYGPVYSFTYGSFGYPGYGGSACHGGFTGGLDLGFFYSGGDFFFGAATRFR